MLGVVLFFSLRLSSVNAVNCAVRRGGNVQPWSFQRSESGCARFGAANTIREKEDTAEVFGSIISRARGVMVVLLMCGAATFAHAACSVTPAGSVICDQDTTSTDTVNTDGKSPSSQSRMQFFSNGSPIDAEIAPGVAIRGAGLELKESDGRRRTPRSIALTNDGTVAAQSEGTKAGIRLVGNGAPVTYGGFGSVSDGIGFALSATNIDGNIAIIADGNVAAGTRLTTAKGNRDNTPPGIKAIEYGAGDIMIAGAGNVSADNGRGIWADEQHKGMGNILVTGTGDVFTRGRICPGKGNFNHDLAKGKIGCSGIRATIDNADNPGSIVVNRSGNLTATSAGVNTITHGNGSTFVTTGQSARIVGLYEFGLESMSSGSGSITITTAAEWQRHVGRRRDFRRELGIWHQSPRE